MNPILGRMTISLPQPTRHITPKDSILSRLTHLETPIIEPQSQTFSTPITERIESNGGYSPKPDWLEDNGILTKDLAFNGQPDSIQVKKINKKTHTVVQLDGKAIADAAEKDTRDSGYGDRLVWDKRREKSLEDIKHDSIIENLPELELQNGAISIGDGRHRLNRARQLDGLIRVLVPMKDAKTFRGMFGERQ